MSTPPMLRVHRPFVAALAACALAATAAAQGGDTELNARQAKAMNNFAKKALKEGFPRVAKQVWMQLIKLYEPDNAEAWTALGYVKMGASWNPDPKRPYPTQDTGAGADGQALSKQWEALKKDLANQHRAVAEKLAKAGDKARADKHWAMVLRWVDKDEQAQAALNYVEVGAISGTELEKTLYDRSKAVEKAVEEQSKIDYPVEEKAGVECAPLLQAQVPYVTVTSEHFMLHGDKEELENLKEALRWAERTLRVCKVAFPWQLDVEKWPQDWACFTKKETYQQILRANKVPDLEWKLENTSTSGIGNTAVASTSGKQVLLDSCVRNVARGYAGFGSDGFVEGIGHTFVGMIFNNNRLFSVDLKKQQGTAASEEDREFSSPDFDVWKNLSLELAWKSSGGIPANKLPFSDASNFSNEERIKAWSFCDYMMRRDPQMLRTMDGIALDLQKRRVKQPAEFEKAFAEAHKDVTVPQLDKEWEDFWTGASPVLKAIQNNTPPLSASSKGVDKWIAAFNEARKANGKTPVTWSANFSARCKEHAEYLKKNKDLRDPASMHTQTVDLGGTYVGSLFAQMALVQPNASIGNAKKMFERWLYWPGYRDALMNNTILTIGMFLDGDVLVVNATSGIGQPKASESGADCFPPRNDTGLIFDGEVPVAELGPEAAELLKANGREGRKSIGFPLTLHFGSTGGIGVRGSLTCTVVGPKGDPIEGKLVYDDGEIRTTTAPGMATFWPLDPLPKGKVSFQWTWMGSDKQIALKGAFSSK
ncbi:MAG: CAP domain-containing protein [Planctomycetota bacterium]